MTDWRSEIRRRLAHARLSPAREAEVIEELSQHLQDRCDELRAAGEDDAIARSTALAELDQDGAWPVEPAAPSTQIGLAAGGATMRGILWQDVRYGVGTLRKTPGFTAVVVLTLALGIGATTAIFSVLDGVLLRPLPYPDIERIVTLTERTTAGRGMSVSWPDFQDWRAQNQVFEHLGVYRGTTVNLTGADQPERLIAALASSEVFGATGVPPLAGRIFGATEDRAGTNRVTVISERLWRSRFSADPGIVGRAITLNGQPHTVIGIMPAAMRFPSRLTDVWLPLGLAVPTFPPRGAHPGLTALGKMKPGVTLQQANTDLDTIALRFAQQYPETNKNTRVLLVSYYEQVVRNIRPALLTLIAAVGFVLLVACANLANMMLAKAEGRRREMAIRSALAASIRREIAAIDPDIPIYGLQTMEQYLSQNTEQPRLTVMLLTGFGALALILAIVGIYGVLSYSVSSRTQEIGIRLALGATRGDVMRHIVGHGMRLTGIGAAVGLAASWGITQSMRALLYDLSPHDPVTYAWIVTVIAVVALLASYLPARRATRVDPLIALRTE